MAEKLDPKEMVSFEELFMSNVIKQEALVNLQEAKGVIAKVNPVFSPVDSGKGCMVRYRTVEEGFRIPPCASGGSG
jgi:hypothetical protein